MTDNVGNTAQTVFKRMIAEFRNTMKTLENRGGISEDSMKKSSFSGY